ncbi:hypothetical protein HmCmsJML025_03605 [Escherichia coli]|nr:hypothetical protein HmCmsJML025_03605 [Escherichia coli]
MPDNAFFHTRVQLALNRFGGEELRVAHDVFLDAARFGYIHQRIAQDKCQPIPAQQRGAEAVCRAVVIFVGLKFRVGADHFQVVVFQDGDFGFF